MSFQGIQLEIRDPIHLIRLVVTAVFIGLMFNPPFAHPFITIIALLIPIATVVCRSLFKNFKYSMFDIVFSFVIPEIALLIWICRFHNFNIIYQPVLFVVLFALTALFAGLLFLRNPTFRKGRLVLGLILLIFAHLFSSAVIINCLRSVTTVSTSVVQVMNKVYRTNHSRRSYFRHEYRIEIRDANSNKSRILVNSEVYNNLSKGNMT